MPDKAVHLAQARHNHEFFRTIDLDAYPDWALTVLFYAAVHYIDSKLAENAIHPDNHNSRDGHVANHPVLTDAYDASLSCTLLHSLSLRMIYRSTL